MNTGNLKNYAPQARKDFIAAVTARANLLGLSDAKDQLVVTEAKASGDLVMIAGRPWPVKVNEQRNKLIARMRQEGFGHTVEAVAYAWFNRLAALRFMELHDYLGHGRRVLSNPQGGLPEVLAHALDLAESNALPGLSTDTVRQLKLANQDPELYRLVLIAQCNALHHAMPFLFEQLGDETELLLSENLLLTDSVVAKMVQSIPEQDWQQIEIIGWLYQFYISEKKDQVIGKVVKSEDIPAATQLFTPNWIVKYMVQNSLGAQWLATYPDSPLKTQMDYYIEPADQTNEVNAQLAAITPMAINPEELTLIDPACGSGHILVEAYDLLKAIYLERGYRQRDVPKLILEMNLFGLDIDERAAQLTGFALMMKGRADDRKLFEREVTLNVMALVDSAGFNDEALAQAASLVDYGLLVGDLSELKRLFVHATTFGSLIRVPDGLAKKLPALKALSQASIPDIFASEALKYLKPLVRQAELLAAQYDAVVANPPYMGAKGMNALVKQFAKRNFPDAKNDLFACFIERVFPFAKSSGFSSMVTMESWMFLSGYEQFRRHLFDQHTLCSLGHFPYDGKKPTVMGINFGIAVVSVRKARTANYQSLYSCSRYYELTEDGRPREFPSRNERLATHSSEEFAKIPGSPVAYWAGSKILEIFHASQSLGEIAPTRKGMVTANNDIYTRAWPEISLSKVSFRCANRMEAVQSDARWFPYIMGGDFRKWFGNRDYLVNWEKDGASLRTTQHPTEERIWATNFNLDQIFLPNINWNSITSASLAFRVSLGGELFASTGLACFPVDHFLYVAGFMNSIVATALLAFLTPTMSANPGDIARLPLVLGNRASRASVARATSRLVEVATADWNAYERSWDFQCLPIIPDTPDASSVLESSYTAWIKNNYDAIAEMRSLEEENNRLFIDAYGLQDELSPEVPIEKITLTVNPSYRYGGKLAEEEQWRRFRQDTCAELVSYAIGCMMGRYSLDAPSLIYANSGNVGFEPSRYTKFPADADGIVPITDELWFEDDAALRIREFLLAVWGDTSLEQNMVWLAESLGRKASESPDETIRRHLADRFFKDHLQTYKKRPIYWLFSSGKQGAFQALVYLHRYNAGTLSRLRAEYVIPLTGKMQARIEQLERDVTTAGSTAVRNRSNKQLESLRKKHQELLAYDEQLRHHADQRIELDLDDGVKVNYGKFGDLLAEVKSIVAKQEED